MKKFLIGLGIFLLLMVVLNLALEPVAKHYVNKELGKLEGYQGHVEDIDIALWRGAYKIEGLYIEKIGSKAPEPFFGANVIDISVQWAALFKGAIVGEVIIDQPKLNFAVEPSTGEVQTGGNNDWTETVKNLVPIQINRFVINQAQIFYKDPTSNPKISVELKRFDLLATNLGNADDSDSLLPAHLTASGNMSGNGKLRISADLNPLKKIPDFDLSLELNALDLTYLKDLTEAYANFTFKDRRLFLSSEFAMKDGQFKGYVKPLLKNVQVIDLDNKESSFWRKAWEVAVGTVMELFENQRKDQFGTKVPFEGNVNDTEVGSINTLANVLRNAFIQAFNNDVDQTININSTEEESEDKGFFEELFDEEEKEEKSKN